MQRIAAKERALREQLQIARADAKPGDLLTPETAMLFRRLLAVPLKTFDARENLAAIRDDAPAPFTPTINHEYPPMQPLSTVPPDVLRALPTLPPGI